MKNLGADLGYVGEAGFFPEHGIYMVLLTNRSHDLKEIDRTIRLNRETMLHIQNTLFDKSVNILPIPEPGVTIDIGGRISIGGLEFDSILQDGILTITSTRDNLSLLDVFLQQEKREESTRS